MLRRRLQVGRWGVEGEKELGNVDQDNEGGKKGHEVKVMILRHSVVAHLCSWKGREVNRIKRETGVSIDTPSRREKLETHTVVMVGSREALGRAEAMVQDICRNTEVEEVGKA